jgi:hypothetical protein
VPINADGADLPRILTIMGSGETTPTMVKTHRRLLERVGPPPVPTAVLDTPYGFQANASDISARTLDYFRASVGQPVEVASLRRVVGADPLALEASLAQVAAARWVFAGPGSPTYALAQWRASAIPRILADKLAGGGCVIFSSAAALTLGRWSVPVYEVYKVGLDPEWADGLDLLSAALGWSVAVIPHYDNAEGGNHDTRFCYLGEPRLEVLESRLPDDGWVLGVDEHTALILDLDAGTAAVEGLGTVTVRRRGRSSVISAGTTLTLTELVGLAFTEATADDDGAPAALGAVGSAAALGGETTTGAGAPRPGADGPGKKAATPLLAAIERLALAFDQAVGGRDAAGAARAALELEAELHEWAADTNQSDEVDRGRSALRGMIVRLGQLAVEGVADPRDRVAPWVEALLQARKAARQERRFDEADRIRDQIIELGVEVRDTPAGTDWELVG